MTRPLALLAALVALAACTTPATTPASPSEAAPADPPPGERIREPGFDAAAWVAAVRAAGTDAERVELSERLLDAVDWRTACGEDDPTAPGRGLVQVHDTGGPGGRVLAEVTCQRRAYQSVFALVDAGAGRPPVLVRSVTVTDEGEPTDNETPSFFGFVSVADGPAETFDVLTKSAGHGGCGTDVRYRILPDGGAEPVEVRAHGDCDDPLAPEAWPVTYRADS